MSKQKLRVGLDVDGVIMDFVSAFRDEAKTLFGRQFPTFSTTWNFDNWYLNPEEYQALWNQCKDSVNWFLLKEKALPGVSKNLIYLDSISELYFVTNRLPTRGLSALQQTQYQLVELGIEHPTVIVRKDKGPVVSGLGLDVYVDDYVENLKRVEECSPSTDLILLNQTYNSELPIPEKWTRVESLAGVIKFVKSLGEI